MPDKGLNFLILDEVTCIRDWDKGVKYLADAGLLENVVFILAGSDRVIIKEARLRFPGRRGQSDRVDFFLYPLNFFECVKLKSLFTNKETDLLLNTGENPPADLMSRLFSEFQNHLAHGGFLTAINDFAREGRILTATFSTFYIKAMGEIDIAYVYENRFWPVEIKWTRQIRPKQLKQIAKYPNGKILTQSSVSGEMNGVPTEPLPLALLRLDGR
jgi:predicted AAA+ superfamily ATPase